MIFDLHNDVLTAQHTDADRQLIFSRYRDLFFAGKPNTRTRIVLALWSSEWEHPLPEINRRIRWVEEAERAAMAICTMPDAGAASWFRFALEDLFFATDENLDEICMLPLLYCGLTWNLQNKLAGGAHANSRLTAFGKKAIRMLESKNITIDTAHLNVPSFWDVMEYAANPVICSHTCFCGLYAHKRNLSDRQIQAVIASGGVVGLTLVPQFLTTGISDITDVVRHIDYFVCKFGDRHLSIGTDFYGTNAYPSGLANYFDFLDLKERLKKMGYNQNSINCIFYQNAAQFFEKSAG